MQTRRAFLTSAALAALALPLSLPRARPPGGWLLGFRARRLGGVFLVDGWILTAADVAALRRHAR